MTLAWRSWLPKDAAVPAAAQRMLASLVEDWSGEWFKGEPMRVLSPLERLAAPRAELRKTQWLSCDEGAAIGLSPTGLTALGAHLLDLSAAAGSRSEEDRKLLDALGKECLDALKFRLARLFGISKPQWRRSDIVRGEGAIYRLEVGSAVRSVTIQLELSITCFARFVQNILPYPASARTLSNGAEALAGLPVSISALLGSCGLSLAELSGLTVGDVLVLESETADSLPLVIADALLSRGRCTVTEAGDGLALNIVQAPTQ